MDHLIASHKAQWAKAQSRKPKKRTKVVIGVDQGSADGDVTVMVATGPGKVWNQSARMDQEHLKSIENHDDRLAPKAIYVNKYRDYLMDYIQQGNTEQSDVLGLNLIWAADVKDYDWMTALVDYAVKIEQQPVKPWFKSQPATLVADSIFQKSEKAFKADNKTPDIFERVFDKILDEDWQVHTFTKARYNRLAGLEAIENENWEDALERLTIADKLKDDIGVKGRIKTLQEGTEAQKMALKKKKPLAKGK